MKPELVVWGYGVEWTIAQLANGLWRLYANGRRGSYVDYATRDEARADAFTFCAY